MKRLLTVCFALAAITTVCSAQEPDDWTTQVTFFTPSIVRIYKTGPDNPDKKQSLSVIRAISHPDGGPSALGTNYRLRIRYLPEDPPRDGYKTRGN